MSLAAGQINNICAALQSRACDAQTCGVMAIVEKNIAREACLVSFGLDSRNDRECRTHAAHTADANTTAAIPLEAIALDGDPVYGGRPRIPAGASDRLVEALRGFSRQALHAQSLGLLHPVSGEPVQFECPLPRDMRELIDVLEQEDPAGG